MLMVDAPRTGEVIKRRVDGRPHEVLDVLQKLPRSRHAVYEAGPTATGSSIERGWRVSGGRSARRPTSSAARANRIKSDKRDAIRLARLFAVGELRLVWVPSDEQV